MRNGRLLLLSRVRRVRNLADRTYAAGAVTDLLREADRLAWLTNWHAALPLYTRAEAESRATRDARRALYAKFGRLRGLTGCTISKYVDCRLSIHQLSTSSLVLRIGQRSRRRCNRRRAPPITSP